MHIKSKIQPVPYPCKSSLSLEWLWGVNILKDEYMTVFHYYLERGPQDKDIKNVNPVLISS